MGHTRIIQHSLRRWINPDKAFLHKEIIIRLREQGIYEKNFQDRRD